jgi:hypothetical protein
VWLPILSLQLQELIAHGKREVFGQKREVLKNILIEKFVCD